MSILELFGVVDNFPVEGVVRHLFVRAKPMRSRRLRRHHVWFASQFVPAGQDIGQ